MCYAIFNNNLVLSMLDVFDLPSKDSCSDICSCTSSTDSELSSAVEVPSVEYHSSEHVEINRDIADAHFSIELGSSVYSNLAAPLSSCSIGPNNATNSNLEFNGLTHV